MNGLVRLVRCRRGNDRSRDERGVHPRLVGQWTRQPLADPAEPEASAAATLRESVPREDGVYEVAARIDAELARVDRGEEWPDSDWKRGYRHGLTIARQFAERGGER